MGRGEPQRLTPDPMTVPTIDDLMAQTAIGNGLHSWSVEGGAITVDADQLRRALELAYDPMMPDWAALITWDSEDGFWVA